MKVIILNGVALSGKDSLADFIIKHSNNTVTKISTVDKVKEICQDIFGVDPNEKTDKNRKLWCDFKSMWSDYCDGPFNQIVEFIKNSNKNIFCVFVREPSEIQKFKNYYKDDCITILIRRDGLSAPNNHADQNVENYEYDYYIHNRSLKFLEFKAKAIVNEIKKTELQQNFLISDWSPKINIKCEISENGIAATTYLNIIRVEKEDDGSLTAVTDHWPKQTP